jgi:ABC-type nitrate/sulfonate/bicarbonate transport system substrate-binding protein
MTLSRRQFHQLVFGSAAAVGLSAAAACSEDEASGFGMAVQLSWVKDVSFAGTYIAVENGYFAQSGLAVELRAGGPDVLVPAVVSAGTALIGMASADVTAAARAEGRSLRIIGARFQRSPHCIISLPNRPISTPQDMVGARIGVSPTNTLAFESFLKINNIRLD